MGQFQPRMDDAPGKRQEKESPIEKDRANASFTGPAPINNPALKWADKKPSPASRPV